MVNDLLIIFLGRVGATLPSKITTPISLWARALAEISAIFGGRIGKNRFLAFFCHIEFTRTYVSMMYCEISVRAKWREPRNKVHPEE